MFWWFLASSLLLILSCVFFFRTKAPEPGLIEIMGAPNQRRWTIRNISLVIFAIIGIVGMIVSIVKKGDEDRRLQHYHNAKTNVTFGPQLMATVTPACCQVSQTLDKALIGSTPTNFHNGDTEKEYKAILIFVITGKDGILSAQKEVSLPFIPWAGMKFDFFVVQRVDWGMRRNGFIVTMEPFVNRELGTEWIMNNFVPGKWDKILFTKK